MTFKIEFETVNAAFGEGDGAALSAVCSILTAVSERVAEGRTEGPVFDVNGNRIGAWEWETESADRADAEFLKHNPTLLRTIHGWKFYEHPIYGDEATVIAVSPAGKLLDTLDVDLPNSNSWAVEQMIDGNEPSDWEEIDWSAAYRRMQEAGDV